MASAATRRHEPRRFGVVDRPQDISSSNWGMVELIEAAARSGSAGRGARCPAAARRDDRDLRHRLGAGDQGPLVARSWPTTRRPRRCYVEAIERLQRSSVRIELARAHLLYGEWLRRERRRTDARERLQTAREHVRQRWAPRASPARAERELLAIGGRVRKRGAQTREELTSQEAQIARLAREGLSNADIGARLFISQHTVAYHLRKVFTKLDITSRNQLGAALSLDPA